MELEVPTNKRLAEQFWVRHENGRDRVSLEEARKQARFPITVILDRVRSAHNVGSIFRTADGSNIGELVLCGYTPAPPHRHLEKTALGAVDVVPWRQSESAARAIEECRAQGMQVLAAEFTEGSAPLDTFQARFPLALVLGNEADGLDEEVINACDACVHLPMRGLKSSLNVSVAFGVFAYELARRYEKTEVPS
jgi:23S rRNA (guanosine2251-2'-O)-methyltransferase